MLKNGGATAPLAPPVPPPMLPGEHGEIWGRLEVGWEKVAWWSTKAAISLKPVKIEKKLLREPIGTHLRSFERWHARPARPPLLQDWGSHPTQNSNRYYLGNG